MIGLPDIRSFPHGNPERRKRKEIVLKNIEKQLIPDHTNNGAGRLALYNRPLPEQRWVKY
jgi:hypothetical protein